MSPEELFQHREEFFEMRIAQMRRQNSGFIKGNPKDILSPEEAAELGIEHDVLLDFQIDFLNQIELIKSQSSPNISEIESFTFGPFSSRFWVMRKHINQMSYRELCHIPFFAWNCITLNIKNKGSVHMIIYNEDVMSKLIKFLIYSMETLDGKRGTATKFIQMKKH